MLDVNINLSTYTAIALLVTLLQNSMLFCRLRINIFASRLHQAKSPELLTRFLKEAQV